MFSNLVTQQNPLRALKCPDALVYPLKRGFSWSGCGLATGRLKPPPEYCKLQREPLSRAQQMSVLEERSRSPVVLSHVISEEIKLGKGLPSRFGL